MQHFFLKFFKLFYPPYVFRNHHDDFRFAVAVYNEELVAFRPRHESIPSLCRNHRPVSVHVRPADFGAFRIDVHARVLIVFGKGQQRLRGIPVIDLV
ncbi:MAG: hypothetical protein RSA12_05680, partial [Clostridia bacterium]